MNMSKKVRLFPFALHALAILAITALVGGCSDDDVSNPDQDNPSEVITTLNLTLVPAGGGPAVTAQFRDADGPGGTDPTQTTIELAAGVTYTMTLDLLNETVPPADEEYHILEEVKEEAEQHQFFFTGSAVGSLVSVTYADKESDYTDDTAGGDLPVGIASTVSTLATGSGDFTVTLKHQPPVNDNPVKTATSGIGDGETDLEITFVVNVN